MKHLAWPVRPLKRHLVLNDGGSWGDEPQGQNDTLVLRSTEQTAEGAWAISEPAWRHLPPRMRQLSQLREGDLLVTKSSGSPLHLGKTTYVTAAEAAWRAGFSNFMQRLRTDRSLLGRYAWYAMRSRFVREQIDLLSTTSTGLANLTRSALDNLAFPIPDMSVQLAVVDFLDRETGEIDAFIRDQEDLIGLLQERRAATICHAVTKGLNLSTPLKESGSNWIGLTPRHWTVTPLKHVATFEAGGTPSSDNPVNWSEHGGTPWLTISDMHNAERGLPPKRHLSALGLMSGRLHVSPSPAVLFAMYASVGEVAAIPAGYTWNQALLGIIPRQSEMRVEFLAASLRSLKSALPAFYRSNTQDNVNAEQVGNLLIPVPPLEEQETIAKELRDATGDLDLALADAREAVRLSKERRSALISAAVTGEIDVREHVGA